MSKNRLYAKWDASLLRREYIGNYRDYSYSALGRLPGRGARLLKLVVYDGGRSTERKARPRKDPR